MKIIKRKSSKEVGFVFEDDADIKVEKDKLGKSVIHIANYPPARVEGKTTYLGGTYICDHDFVDDADIVDDVQNVPADTKDRKYKYDKKAKTFTAAEIGG